jgi:hypothetical protein
VEVIRKASRTRTLLGTEEREHATVQVELNCGTANSCCFHCPDVIGHHTVPSRVTPFRERGSSLTFASGITLKYLQNQFKIWFSSLSTNLFSKRHQNTMRTLASQGMLFFLFSFFPSLKGKLPISS